ncbi:MAG: 4Fe-4S binding protein [Leptospiraceae bacterium]
MDRKDFFSRGIKDLTRKAYRTPPGQWLDKNLQAMSNLLSPAWGFGISEEKSSAPEPQPFSRNRGLPRPPGALPDPAEFNKACTACGDCIVACPYGAIFTIPDVYGPVLDPNHLACHLCEDYPCIEACPDSALLPLEEGSLPGFGLAELHQDACLNEHRKKGQKKCKECYEQCPVENAIIYDTRGLPDIQEQCTGCGLCVEHCPTGALKVTWG